MGETTGSSPERHTEAACEVEEVPFAPRQEWLSLGAAQCEAVLVAHTQGRQRLAPVFLQPHAAQAQPVLLGGAVCLLVKGRAAMINYGTAKSQQKIIKRIGFLTDAESRHHQPAQLKSGADCLPTCQLVQTCIANL
eukprot:3084411-Pleurochrysis_carterae.AAC.2